MTDRERDLSLLKSFCARTRQSIQGWGVIVNALCTTVIVLIAFWSIFRSGALSAGFVLVALFACMSLATHVIQYYVVGPLFREVQRLEEEIDALKTE